MALMETRKRTLAKILNAMPSDASADEEAKRRAFGDKPWGCRV